MNPSTLSCAIFCRVIDNFGDAGVCWRLARQLAEEYRWKVTLYIDAPQRLASLVGDDCSLMVDVQPWGEASLAAVIPDVVIEAFACDLPARYIQAMSQLLRPPVWISLDYLSAEKWVDDCHQLPSPHPHSHLIKHFFFPGFSLRTGGVLRERNYVDRQNLFDRQAVASEWQIPQRDEELRISYFSYAGTPFEALKTRLAESFTPVRLLIPGGENELSSIGNLTLQSITFLPQLRYDELLWFCDINFVRGEDSFVRAQLTGKPLIWSIYPQDDGTHQKKLEAFLSRYLEIKADQGASFAESGLATIVRDCWTQWNTGDMFNWNAYVDRLSDLRTHADAWRNYLFQQADLAQQLTQFCDELLDRIE